MIVCAGIFTYLCLFLVTREAILLTAVHKWTASSNPELNTYRKSLANDNSDDFPSSDSESGDLAPQHHKKTTHFRSLSPVAGPSRVLRSQSGTMTFIPGHDDIVSVSSDGMFVTLAYISSA